MEELKISTLKDLYDKIWLGNKNDKGKLRFAYNFSKVKFDWMYRKSWEPYFNHLVRTAEILINELWINDVDIVALALIHDLKEDTNAKDDTIKIRYWEKMLEKLRKLSKNDESLEGKDKAEKTKNYFERLKNCEYRDVALVKLADRIDNLRTMKWIFKPEKIKRKIKETEEYLLPLAKKYSEKAYKIIKEEIRKLENYLKQAEMVENLSSNKK